MDELLSPVTLGSLVVRNRVPHAAAMIGLVGAGRSFALVYAFQSPAAMARDVEKLRPAVLVADREDWTAPVVEAAARVGTVGARTRRAPTPSSRCPTRQRNAINRARLGR